MVLPHTPKEVESKKSGDWTPLYISDYTRASRIRTPIHSRQH